MTTRSIGCMLLLALVSGCYQENLGPVAEAGQPVSIETETDAEAPANSILHSRTGIILVVSNFEECVAFYRDLFGLKVMHEKVQGDFRLTCLEFGNGYLMIESAPPFPQTASEKNLDQNPTKLRFNVSSIEDALKNVHAYGIDAQIDAYDWGSSINITDPDGNRVGIRDQQGFDRDNTRFAEAQALKNGG